MESKVEQIPKRSNTSLNTCLLCRSLETETIENSTTEVTTTTTTTNPVPVETTTTTTTITNYIPSPPPSPPPQRIVYRYPIYSWRDVWQYPRFERRLYDIHVTEGHHGRLEVRISGVPKPDVRWYKDWQPLSSNSKYTVRLRDLLQK